MGTAILLATAILVAIFAKYAVKVQKEDKNKSCPL